MKLPFYVKEKRKKIQTLISMRLFFLLFLLSTYFRLLTLNIEVGQFCDIVWATTNYAACSTILLLLLINSFMYGSWQKCVVESELYVDFEKLEGRGRYINVDARHDIWGSRLNVVRTHGILLATIINWFQLIDFRQVEFE